MGLFVELSFPVVSCRSHFGEWRALVVDMSLQINDSGGLVVACGSRFGEKKVVVLDLSPRFGSPDGRKPS
jgi:hypothetical protein